MRESHAKILLRCMVVMASADDCLQPEEVSVISEVFEKLTGHPLDQVALGDILKADHEERLSILNNALAAGCTPELKKLIAKACYLVTIADRKIAASEVDMLATIAAALDISETELSQLIREVSPS